jgi:serine protease Do
VVAGSPAEAAGLRAGDVLLSSGGVPVDVRFTDQLPEFNRRLLGTPVGTRVELVFLRDGKEQRAGAVTVARGAAEGDEAEVSDWGVAVQEITLLAAKELEREPGSGVLIDSVRPGTAAAEAKPDLRPRDIVVEVAGRPVRSTRELTEATARALAGKTGTVPTLIGFERGRQRMLTVLNLGTRRAPDHSAAATKAWLPAVSQVLTPDLAEALGLKGQTGVRLTQIYPGSTAAAAGLKVGDVVLKFDGESIAASRPEDVEVLPAMVRQRDIGAKVKLDIVRDGRPQVVEVELAPSPSSTRELVEYHDAHFEFSARDLAFEDRQDPALEKEQRGALVTEVESGGWAALAHLAVGDLLLSVDGKAIDTAAGLEERMNAIAQARPSHVVFLVRRGVHTLFLELEPAWA